jgi:glycosyltransferase involved in cell wall biosynthesis
MAEQSFRPSVDVVIPVFNGERFLGDTLASVISQTCAPQKIIVVNDGSTDGTERMVESYPSPIPIQHIKQANRGLSSARNAGIANCDSQCVAFLDADDLWEPSKIERQVALFLNSPFSNLGAVYCGIKKVDAVGADRMRPDVRPFETGIRGQILDRLIHSNCVTGSASSVMIRRECLATVGLFDESLPTCEDWDMWLRMALRFQFDFVDEPLVRIREHKASMSTNTDRMIVGRILVLSKLLKTDVRRTAVMQELRYQILRLAICRRLKLTTTDLEEYLEPRVVVSLITNPIGMISALFVGLAKLSRRASKVYHPGKVTATLTPACPDVRGITIRKPRK